MKQTRSPRHVAGTFRTLGLLGAMFLSTPARSELLTDYVTATNAAAGSFFAGSMSVNGGLAVGNNLTLVKPRATGGMVTYVNGRETHTFLSTGTLSVAVACTADCLVVAGGGGGARCGTAGGAGGGGAGGLVYTSITVAAQSYTIAVGAGGNGGTGAGSSGAAGSNSMFGSITAYGGGAGAWNAVGGAGGSGGGGAHGNVGGDADYISPRQGYDGGSSVAITGGGGGGAGAVGGNASTGVGGNGGAGFACSISGSNTYYAGGGGGGATNSCGTGGIGGGGDASSSTAGKHGTNGLGGGGGAGWNNQNGGGGGSGIVIISLSADSGNVDVTSALQSSLVNASNALAVANGKLSPSDSGSQLTGITASQVGAVSTNDSRYLAALQPGALAGYLPSAGGTMNGQIYTWGGFVFMDSNTLSSAWTMYYDPLATRLMFGRWGSGSWSLPPSPVAKVFASTDDITNAIAGITAAQLGALTTNALMQMLTNFMPYGDVPMGCYTNRNQ